MSHKYVYLFSEGNGQMRELLGGKGANLAEMTSLGMPVPQGFTITTEACTQYYKDDHQINADIEAEIMQYVEKLEEMTGKKFGDLYNPLLVSVRSGARASMPGMMDTILNLGLNDEVVVAFANKTNNPRFAYDSYRRFIQMYSDVVMEVGKKYFEQLIDEMKEARGVTLDTELTADDLKELAEKFKAEYREKLGEEFPQDPKVQLMGAIKAVFRSWDNPRAIYYRRMNDIPSDWGTAVNVQSMVFGNTGDTSGTGVAFTRNPATGEKKLFGEFLMNAQGEDVVAGVRTPQTIDQLAQVMPEAYKQFVDICAKLEYHYRDMQDMEFTIEDKKLYMLQTRNGKRTAAAAMKIACDLVDEGMISEKEAVAMIDPKSLDALLHPTFDAAALKKAKVVGTGLAASPGAACGKIVFTAETATEWAKNGQKVVLVRLETSPEDIEGMHYAQGVLTVRGGMTSHAAVVARGMGTCCVSGCGAIKMNEEAKTFELAGKTYKESDWISIDGSTGNIYGEKIKTAAASISGDFNRLMTWADKFRRLQVRTNADTPHDAQQAAAFGAEGIGLFRTEFLFMDRTSLPDEMVQYEAYRAVSQTMAGKEVIIRTLDVGGDKAIEYLGMEQEENPFLGHRAIRYCLDRPDLYKVQLRALLRAGAEERNIKIMLPLVTSVEEVRAARELLEQCKQELAEAGLPYDKDIALGVMIETPAAALTADLLARESDFFSIGTNDLTQYTCALDRQNAKLEPFFNPHHPAVLRAIKMTIEAGHRHGIWVGICGELGADTALTETFLRMGVDELSMNAKSILPVRKIIRGVDLSKPSAKNV